MKLSQNLKTYSIIGIIGVISVIYQGFDFGIVNNYIQIPLLSKARNVSLYPNDPFVSSLDKYNSVLWLILSKFTFVKDWEHMFLWFHIVNRIVFLILLYNMVVAILPNTIHPRYPTMAIAITGLSSTLMGFSGIGKSDLMIPYFNHTEVALTCLILAYCLHNKRKYVYAYVVAGLTFNVNAFYGAWCFVSIVFAQVIYSHVFIKQRLETLKYIKYLFLFVAISAPTIIWIVASTEHGGNFPLYDYREYLYEYFPKHFFIDSATKYDIYRFINIVATGSCVAIMDRNLSDETKFLYIGLVYLFIIGSFLPLFSNNRFSLNLHMLRIDSIIMILTIILVIGYILKQYNEANDGKSKPIEFLLPVIGIIIGNWVFIFSGVIYLIAKDIIIHGKHGSGIMSVAVLTIISAMLLFYLDLPILTSKFSILLIYEGIAVLFIAAIFYRRADILHFGLLGIAFVVENKYIVMIILLRHGLAIAYYYLKNATVRHFDTFALTGCFVISFMNKDNYVVPLIICFIIAMYAPLNMTAPKVRFGSDGFFKTSVILMLMTMIAYRGYAIHRQNSISNMNSEGIAWRKAQVWTKANTPIDAVFMVPIERGGFLTFSERSVWVDHWLGAAAMWDPKYYWVWKKRIAEQTSLTSEKELETYSKKNKIKYVVMPLKGKDVGLEVVYRNSSYKICRMW